MPYQNLRAFHSAYGLPEKLSLKSSFSNSINTIDVQVTSDTVGVNLKSLPQEITTIKSSSTYLAILTF